ncbi:MAG: endonuclease domain-containing protein [Thermoanaerobaculia bacterium]
MKLEVFRMLQRRANGMRREETEAEKILWDALRSRNLADAKFRRQQLFGPYIADFYCHERRLVIEVDGAAHGKSDVREYDELRTQYLQSLGLRVLRFWNAEVLQNLESVLATIERELEPRG